MKRRPSRRTALTLAAAAALSAALSSSPAFAQSGRFDGVTLRVGTYGGPWKDALHANVGSKLEALGAKVEYVIGNPAENFSKIVAARGRAVPIDVMEIGPAERMAMTRNGFLEELPAARIPNLSKLSSQILDKQVISHQMVQNGILYRVDKFKAEQLPVPTRFEDLISSRLADRVAFPDVTNPQHWPAVAALASTAGGSESAPEKGFEQVLKMKPLYYYASASELSQKVALGDVIAAPWLVGPVIRLARGGHDVGFVHPRIGSKKGEVEFNYLGIVKGTKNAEAAAAFINAFLDTPAQTEFSRLMGVVPTNRESRAQLSKDPLLNKFMLLSDEDLANAYSIDWSKVDVEKWRASWTRTVSK
jgi:putative spermidine/putrescine transport system substrate-binding protein